MPETVCLSCKATISDPVEADIRHYRVISSGTVFGRYSHAACHERYLSEKPGIAATSRPLPSEPSRNSPVGRGGPATSSGSFSMSKSAYGETVIERDGRRFVAAKSDVKGTALRRLMSGKREPAPISLGDSLRAQFLQSRKRDRR